MILAPICSWIGVMKNNINPKTARNSRAKLAKAVNKKFKNSRILVFWINKQTTEPVTTVHYDIETISKNVFFNIQILVKGFGEFCTHILQYFWICSIIHNSNPGTN